MTSYTAPVGSNLADTQTADSAPTLAVLLQEEQELLDEQLEQIQMYLISMTIKG
jgi:hypothetical protein